MAIGLESGTDCDRLLLEVKGWDEAKVGAWLETVKCAHYTSVFISNHINGDALLECDQQALKELGIIKVGDRVRLSVAIKNLRTKCFGSTKVSSIAAALALDDIPPASLHTASTPKAAPARTPTATQAPTISKPPQSTSPGRARAPTGEAMDSPLRSANGMSSLLSNCVKFIGEEGQTRIVNIGDCENSRMILEKALKKFALSESITMDPTDVVENYRVFITAEVGPARQLSEDELFQICQDPYRPERERLILKKKDTAPSILEFQQAQKIAREQQALLKDQAIANNMGKLKKIGGFFGETPQHIRVGSVSNVTSPLDSPCLNQTRGPKARIKEFFGARPPSELISSNLQEYFPEASTSVLEKTVRNSIRRSQRMSVATRETTGRRPSNASLYSIASYQSLAPPIPSVGDAWINATSINKKSRPSSLYRSHSSLSRTDGARSSRRSVGSLAVHDDKDGSHDESDNTAVSLHSRASSVRLTDDENMEDGYSSGPDVLLENDAEDEIELPEYLREKLAQTEVEDGTALTLRAMSMALENGTEIPNVPTPTGTDNDDTGPTSWIKGTLIGQGSFGSVVLGMNALTGELMAVKQVDLPRNANGDRDLHTRKTEMLDALQREIALLRDLQHDNIVQYLGSNSDETHLNIFLEYVPGGSVTEMLTKYGAFKEPLVRQFVRQILTGLNYLHEREIIHRDIKGGNILVDNKGVIKISDFGISKKVDSNMLSMHPNALTTTSSGGGGGGGSKADHRPSLQGSVFWMAPEVVRQTQYTRKADIWSLGCLVVEMLTGRHPYPDLNQMQAIFRIGGADSAPDLPPNLSDDARDFLDRTFVSDYLGRPSASDLLAHRFCHATVA